MTAATGRRLIICECAYRGSAETQFADVLYFIRELSHQMPEGLDLALRGLAVTWALDAEPVPAVALGERTLDTLPDPRATVRLLMEEGVRVSVEAHDLSSMGASPGRLMAGVECVSRGAIAARWASYASTWFM